MLVTKQAPDFTANAFYQGTYQKVKLSDYRGKWVVLCFLSRRFHLCLTD